MSKNIDTIKNKNKLFDNIKFLTQHELSEGWTQKKKNINHKFKNNKNITLAYLPEIYWKSLIKTVINNVEQYNIINAGTIYYTIVETNQDVFMELLYEELNEITPNKLLIEHYVNQIDSSLHTSWLILRAKHYIKYNVIYFTKNVHNIN